MRRQSSLHRGKELDQGNRKGESWTLKLVLLRKQWWDHPFRYSSIDWRASFASWQSKSKQETETAKISIRNARRDAIEALKKSIKTDGVPEDVEKDAEAEVQKVHDKFIKKVDELYIAKEKEIMTV